MWNKTKPDVAPPPARPEPQANNPTPAAQPAAAAARPAEPVSRGTAIGKGVTIIGDVVSKEDWFIDGDI
jgi:hypothetical protein